jgi:hypothetical protein
MAARADRLTFTLPRGTPEGFASHCATGLVTFAR